MANFVYSLEPEIPEVTEENAERLLNEYGLEKGEFTYEDWDYEKDKPVEVIDLDRLQEVIYEYEANDFYEWQLKEIKKSIVQKLKILEIKKTTYRIYVDEADEWTNDRNYPLHIFAKIQLVIPVKYTKEGTTVETEIFVIYNTIESRNSVNNSVNLDYEIEISIGDSEEWYDWNDVDDNWIVEEVVGYLEWKYEVYSDVTERMKEEIEKRAKNKVNFLHRKMKEIQEKIEKEFEKHSVQYKKSHNFLMEKQYTKEYK